MAKVKAKSGLGTVNKVLFIVFLILLVATIVIIAVSAPKVAVKAEVDTGGFVDEVKIDPFVADTYGGIEFKSEEDVVNYYVEAFNYTKTLTAPYTDNGKAVEYYKLMGDENLVVENLLVDGKANATINNLVPSILGGIFHGYPKGLVPSTSYDAAGDKTPEFDKTKSLLTKDDVLACNVKDNGDGTISITIQPKSVILSFPGKDAQGHMFNTLGDISATVEKIKVLSFSEGTIEENFVVNYAGGHGTVTIDTKTKEIISGDFVMNVHIDVQHANVTIIKNKSASLDIVYTNKYPCSDEFLAGAGLARK